jgi:glycosyltransferase involved in cell wall biosynthesis
MDYFPNVDGVNYFAREVFPLIRHQRPDTKFRIIGSNPARSVRDLAGIPNVSVTGQVPDVRSYLEDAAVSVAPLKIARGIQNKILESMAMGIPVVATPQAVKGIGAELSQYVAVAEKPEIFAAQVLALLENNALHTRMAEGGRLQVQQGHAWPSVMEILENLITEDDKGKFAVGD